MKGNSKILITDVRLLLTVLLLLKGKIEIERMIAVQSFLKSKNRYVVRLQIIN